MRHRTGTTKKGCHVAEYHPVARRVGATVETSGRSVHIVIDHPPAPALARCRTDASGFWSRRSATNRPRLHAPRPSTAKCRRPLLRRAPPPIEPIGASPGTNAIRRVPLAMMDSVTIGASAARVAVHRSAPDCLAPSPVPGRTRLRPVARSNASTGSHAGLDFRLTVPLTWI